jgi:four helix bundle suffix protein
MSDESLIPLHGGYRKLKSFQVAQLAYDVTVRAWVQEERRGQTPTDMDMHGPGQSVSASVPVRAGPRAPSSSELVANAALSLLNLACYLLDRQLAAQAAAFEKEGGFTERLYRVRARARTRP